MCHTIDSQFLIQYISSTNVNDLFVILNSNENTHHSDVQGTTGGRWRLSIRVPGISGSQGKEHRILILFSDDWSSSDYFSSQ